MDKGAAIDRFSGYVRDKVRLVYGRWIVPIDLYGCVNTVFSAKRFTMSKRIQLIIVGVVCFVLGAAVALPLVHAQGDKAQGPDWKHGMELRVRKAGEPDFNKDTKKYGIEVFVDKNNGNLIYITETGAIAVVQDKK